MADLLRRDDGTFTLGNALVELENPASLDDVVGPLIGEFQRKEVDLRTSTGVTRIHAIYTDSGNSYAVLDVSGMPFST